MRAFGLALCFILFLKRNSSGICLVKHFPAVFDRDTVQWDVDLCCRGYRTIHAMTKTEQDDETCRARCEGKRLSCCGCWDHSWEVLVTFD